jgi:hypothetical protein
VFVREQSRGGLALSDELSADSVRTIEVQFEEGDKAEQFPRYLFADGVPGVHRQGTTIWFDVPDPLLPPLEVYMRELLTLALVPEDTWKVVVPLAEGAEYESTIKDLIGRVSYRVVSSRSMTAAEREKYFETYRDQVPRRDDPRGTSGV